MKRYCITVLFLTLLVYHTCFSQIKNTRFYLVDSFAVTVKYRGDLAALTRALTAPYPGQLFKARAIFKWITENIRYDCKDYNKHEYRGKPYKEIKCKDDEDCEAKIEASETEYIDKVLKRKKAVCQGYAMLFKRMCILAGLQAEFIPGYIRQHYYQVGMSGSLIHAWNSVLIDSTYYLLDATWAAGTAVPNERGKLVDYIKGLNEYYWLTPPRDFARDHFPQNPKWTLIPNYTIENFADNPYYRPSLLWELELKKPGSGIIRAKLGDTIRFEIYFSETFKHLQINSNIFHNPDIWVTEGNGRRRRTRKLDTFALKLQQYIPYRRRGNLLAFEYVVRDKSLYYLDILCDRLRIMRFNVKVIQ